jgi:5-(carboxyamino)imidazole ribonucleotide synthase
VAIATRVLESFSYVGVIGIELFAMENGSLIVNEIAPRVHNSGHWTEDGCVVDQFEQHIRCLAGWPLGDGSRYADVVMTNLIGDEIAHAHELAADPEIALHLYGKAEVRPGRKMGHANRVRPSSSPLGDTTRR